MAHPNGVAAGAVRAACGMPGKRRWPVSRQREYRALCVLRVMISRGRRTCSKRWQKLACAACCFWDHRLTTTAVDLPTVRRSASPATAASRSPEWMEEHLPAIFARLQSFGAPILHYKTCSTFDSSAQIGSIGRAMEIGQDLLKTPFTPIVVAAPHLRRYVVFGNLFAAASK